MIDIMAQEASLSVLLSSGIGAVIVFLITLPSIWRLGRLFGSSKKHNGPIALEDVYHDEDGSATEDSQAAFSDWLPRTVLYLSTMLGFAASIGSAVLSIVWESSTASAWLPSSWMNVAAWVKTFHELRCFTRPIVLGR